LKSEIQKLEEAKKEQEEKMNSGNTSNDELITLASSLQKLSNSLDEKVLRLLELEEAIANLS
jgi:hypothetical protein